jgi:hypothetical protein
MAPTRLAQGETSSKHWRRFTNDFGGIDFFRTPAAPGTGVTTPRQQTNTLSSFIDASGAYGVDAARLDWLREGAVDGNPGPPTRWPGSRQARRLATNASAESRTPAAGVSAYSERRG